MSFEVEVKYRAVDHDHLVRRLVQVGQPPRSDRSTRRTPTSATRPAISPRPTRRSASAGSGTRTGSPTKALADRGRPRPARRSRSRSPRAPSRLARLLRLFENLGFRPVATIRKQRDVVPPDVPGPRASRSPSIRPRDWAPSPRSRPSPAARPISPLPSRPCWPWPAQLGLTEVEPRSYLRMVLETLEPSVRDHP